MKASTEKAVTESIKCHNCKISTKHLLLTKKIKKGFQTYSDYTEQGFSWSITNEVFQCGGCEEITIRRSSWNDEIHEVETDFYPPREHVKEFCGPIFDDEFPYGMQSLLSEIYSALHYGNYRLVAMGIRSLIEEIMIEKVKDIGGFDKKVDAMVKEGYISRVQKEILEPTLELGHAAIHRGHQPTEHQVRAALDVAINLVTILYVQSKFSGSLKAGVKSRKDNKAIAQTEK